MLDLPGGLVVAKANVEWESSHGHPLIVLRRKNTVRVLTIKGLDNIVKSD